MTTKMNGGSGGMVAMTNMHAGLSRKNPPGVDKSMKLPGKSIDKDALRGGTAPSPRTLGPRNA